MNIGWAQVALSVSFCYGRHRGDGKNAHLNRDAMDKICLNMRECFLLTRSFYRHFTETNYDERVKSGLKLNFNKDDLNQYNPAGFISLGKGTHDFSVSVGRVYWMGPVSSAICVSQCNNLNIFLRSQKGSKKVDHFVVPVGRESASHEERYLVAELLARPPPWGSYWESAAEYFSEKEIVVSESISCE